MRRASRVGILAVAVLAAGCLVEVEVEEGAGDLAPLWLR
jgi:hypothetical protein